MKTKIILTALSPVLLMLIIGLGSCEKKTDSPVLLNKDDCGTVLNNFAHDTSASIIGRWKLERIALNPSHDGYRMCLDPSQYDIVYEFKTDGTLTISGRQSRSIENFLYPGIGNHSYWIDECWQLAELPSVWITIPCITMDNYGYRLTLSANELMFSVENAGLGSFYYLVKI